MNFSFLLADSRCQNGDVATVMFHTMHHAIATAEGWRQKTIFGRVHAAEQPRIEAQTNLHGLIRNKEDNPASCMLVPTREASPLFLDLQPFVPHFADSQSLNSVSSKRSALSAIEIAQPHEDSAMLDLPTQKPSIEALELSILLHDPQSSVKQ